MAPPTRSLATVVATVVVAAALIALGHGVHAWPAGRYARRAAAADGAFHIAFRCDAAAHAFCAKAEAALHRAAERIAAELRFRRAVVVDVALFLPCGEAQPPPECPDLTTLGFATPAQRIPVSHRDATYLYPTALLKQTDLPGLDRLAWPQYDVVARFNAARKWYFVEDGPTMPADARDLELVATHELLHGLALGDDLAMSLQVPNRPLLMPYYDSYPGLVAPVSNDSFVPVNGDVMYRLTAPSAWNRYTQLRGRPVLERYAVINTTVASLASDSSLRVDDGGALNATAVIDRLVADKAAAPAMRDLYTLATTTDTLQLRFTPNEKPAPDSGAAIASDGRGVYLETGLNPFLEGSSLAHVPLAANITPEFLMTYKIGSRDLASLIAATGAPKSGIGPGLVGTLVAMGFTPAGSNNWVSLKDSGAVLDQAVLDAAALVNPSPLDNPQPPPPSNGAGVRGAAPKNTAHASHYSAALLKATALGLFLVALQ